MKEIVKAQFSRVYYVGCIFLYLSSIFSVIAFCSPFWYQLDEEKSSEVKHFKPEFINAGLWQVCFNYYKHPNNKRKTYNGCYYTISPDVEAVRHWLRPGWFVSVQVIVSLEVALIPIYLPVITASLFTRLKRNRYFVAGVAIYSTVVGFIMLAGMLIFAGNANSKEWMPHPELNHYSWSYWSQVVATMATLFSSISFFSEARSLVQLFEKLKQERLDNDSDLEAESEAEKEEIKSNHSS